MTDSPHTRSGDHPERAGGEPDTFPRQKARTRNFTLGVARDFRVAADGQRVVFLRSRQGDDPVTCLWAYDVAEREERLVADPRDIEVAGSSVESSPEEQARRERKRETAEGIVAYSTDADAGLAAFVLSGTLWLCDLRHGGCRALEAPGPALDAHLDPTGTQVAFVYERALHVVPVVDGRVRRVIGEEQETIAWGLAEFVAAEEMARHRGYWWAPQGDALLVARVDVTPVERWWIADPADPGRSPRQVRYPAAGTANAVVTLHVVPLGGGPPLRVLWDEQAYPYVLAACWDEHGPLVAVQTRDQRSVEILAVDIHTGVTTAIGGQHDEAWVEQVGGVPSRLADGRLVMAATVDDSVSLLVDDSVVTPKALQVRTVLDVRGDQVIFTGNDDPCEVQVWRWRATDGLARLTTEPGVHTAAVGGETIVIGSSGLDHDGIRWTAGSHVFRSNGEQPAIAPCVELVTVGERMLRVGIVLPEHHEAGRALPVLMDPYGGPGHQRVLRSRGLWREAQWLANQGFAVVVADGRGTPGRGRAWSHAVHRDLAGPPLEDQVAALIGAASLNQDLDLTRVAIRGWSFGGYLAALAVLRRPDVFHAAIAGAPVTDWRLYDTHYSERYLGEDPHHADRASYDRSSLLGDAVRLRRPLLLIHGLADDNVVAAHTLTLSRRLSEAGRPHTVLPLSGVTHMTPQPAVAENLLLLQVDFLHRALASGW
jgi:dipeptidyl-peptidase-4